MCARPSCHSMLSRKQGVHNKVLCPCVLKSTLVASGASEQAGHALAGGTSSRSLNILP